MNKLKILMETRKTVFTYEEIKTVFSDLSKEALEKSLYRSKKSGELLNPYKWIRTLPVYDEKELACKIKKDSYISLESVLFEAGAIFQAYFNTKTCIASSSADLRIDGKNYEYKKIKDSLLYNDTYIIDYDNYRKARPERALCDLVYLYPRASLDAPEVFSSSSSTVKLEILLPLYPKATQERVKKILDMSDF